MGFKVKPSGKFTFYHTVETEVDRTEEEIAANKPIEMEPTELSVTFDFPFAEDIDYVELRDKASDKAPLLIEDEDGKIKKTDMGTYNAFLYYIRTALVDCSGFVNEVTGEPIKIKSKSGKINTEWQLVIFEAIKDMEELIEKVYKAYMANKAKNG